jgi:formyltetrahydrofolate deformylase
VSEPPSITRLLISCADRPGIVSATSGFLFEAGANIVRSDQYTTNPEGGDFFMRMEFHLPLPGVAREDFERDFAARVAEPLGMSWRMWDASERKRVAILVSREEHCLLDLMWRWRRGSLEGDITLVASNHPDARADVEGFGLPFHHVPVEKGRKAESEERLLQLLAGNCELVVLARYMQILSADFVRHWSNRVINIHHSFLPAFVGARPYHQAHERGVKLIGVTAHYATEDLDEGPIIEQDVARVSHRDSVAELVRRGRDLEMVVLARAVRAHIEHRVLVYGRKTVVFG